MNLVKRALATIFLSLGAFNPTWPHSDLPVVQTNDNRKAAGVLANGVLTVHLVVGMARWYPQAQDGPYVDVPAIGEEGKAPQIPAPLIRVPTGTIIDATIRNTLTDSTIYIRGFTTRPAKAVDSIPIRPGESREIRFEAGAPGDYAYLATPGLWDWDKFGEREASGGAIIVDPPGPRPADRVFVINIWGDIDSKDTSLYHNALAINGKSWPYTERISATIGDTLRWHVVNASTRNHPMHLHGFYFRLAARGTALATKWFPPGEGPLDVTEDLNAAHTMFMTWTPDRPGNWLFHCHIGFHVVPGDADLRGRVEHGSHSMDIREHMAGLVLGINVQPSKGWAAASRSDLRTLHLFVDEGRRRSLAPRALGFVLQNGNAPPAPDSVVIPGSVIVLTKNQPTDIVVVNRLREATSIHWHGVELESFSDGVPGWSGSANHLAPVIAANDSFVAHLTLPRAGTFIYHTHLDDLEQLTSGLYGAIVVLEPGKKFDPETDHVFVAGWDGPADPPHIVINGDTAGAPIEIKSGVANRFRFVNIGPAQRLFYAIRRDTTVQTWRPVAKDGADLPPSAAVAQPASKRLGVGETFDAEFIAPEPGEYRLTIGMPLKQMTYSRRIIVH
ncbi:MAG: multicopper oxidase domain-containing protein [Gemmatimonadaceae bacterium]